MQLMKSMVLPAALVAAAAAPGAAFAPGATLPAHTTHAARAAASARPGAVALRATDGASEMRRHFLKLGGAAALGGMVNVAPASAKKARGGGPPQLLDDDGNPETPEERKARYKAARQASDDARKAAEEKAKAYEAENGVATTEMGSNLRGDYYYPTARKRYLPRVRKAYEELVKVESEPDDWEKLGKFAKGPGDAASALKLYVSALGGGGLSISGNFMSNMKSAADTYEDKFKTFQSAIESKNSDKASAALEDMKGALLAYREAGKPVGLTGDDWGVGAVPNCKRGTKGTGKLSECAVGASFGNNNPNLYSRNLDSMEK